MAIDDNTSYELTGAQVKDLANKIKAKAADNIFVGATYSLGGSKGLVPAPQAGDDTKFLAGDGTWKTAGGGGSGISVFYIDHPIAVVNSYYTAPTLYKDAALTTTATMLEVYEAYKAHGAIIYYPSNIPSEAQVVFTVASAKYYDDEDGDWIRFSVISTEQYIDGTPAHGSNYILYISGHLDASTSWETAQSYYCRLNENVDEYYTNTDADLFGSSPVTFYKNPGMVTLATIGDIITSAYFDNGAIIRTQNSGYSSTKYYTVLNPARQRESNSTVYSFELIELKTGVHASAPKIALYAGASNASTVTPEVITMSNAPFTGATSSTAGTAGLVPAPAAGDEGKALHGDGTWKDTTAKLVEMSYGESSAWAKFIAAYQAGSIVYCRASSNANPGSGSQTRKAFMAYVNNATNPTSVEFQYVRSNSSKSDSNQCDQVFVYTLTNASGGTWSVATRDMAPKILVDSTLNKTFSGGANASVTLGAKAMTGATSGAAGTAGIVPKPNSGDQNKVLTGGGSWVDLAGSYSTSEVATPYTWVDGSTIYKKTINFGALPNATLKTVAHGVSNLSQVVKMEAIMDRPSFGFYPLPFVSKSAANDQIELSVTSTDIRMASNIDWSGSTAYITIYYTKAASEGSGGYSD